MEFIAVYLGRESRWVTGTSGESGGYARWVTQAGWCEAEMCRDNIISVTNAAHGLGWVRELGDARRVAQSGDARGQSGRSRRYRQLSRLSPLTVMRE